MPLNQQGITFLELLLVIAIIVVLAAAATPIYSNFQPQSQLNGSVSQIVQSLRTGVEFSKARYNNAGHGLYLEINPGNDRVILYQGDSYATRDSSYDRIITMDPPITLSSSLPGNEVNFTKGTGYPNNTGTIVIAHSAAGSRSITINAYGVIDAN